MAPIANMRKSSSRGIRGRIGRGGAAGFFLATHPV
jgi:hypothetical protein